MPDEPRRVRTQAERDGDGQAWHPGGFVPGEPVRILLHPAECLVQFRDGGVVCIRDHHQHDPTVEALRMFDPQTMSGTRYAETLRAAFAESAATGKPVLLADGSAEVSAYQPRRRWWHRLTRRNP